MGATVWLIAEWRVKRVSWGSDDPQPRVAAAAYPRCLASHSRRSARPMAAAIRSGN